MRKERVEELAGRQHGLLTRTQAIAAGLSEAEIGGRLRSGRWYSVHRGVYAMAGAPRTAAQSLLAAVLACGFGAMASHRGAAWVWGLADDLSLEVTAPTSRRPRGPVFVHRRDMASERPVLRQGIPCTNPLRTVLDLAAIGDAALVDQAIDRGLATRLFTVDALEAQVDRLARSGRRGVRLLRDALDRRLVQERRPPSVLESRMARLLQERGLPIPRREYPVLDGGYRLDFAWPDFGVCVEVDGYGSHSGWDAFQGDRARQNDLVLAGWVVLRFTWDDVCRRPHAVGGAVSEALAASRPA